MSNQKKSIVLPKMDKNLLAKKGFTIGEQLNSRSFSRVCGATYKSRVIAVKIIDLEKTLNIYRNKFLPSELHTMKNGINLFIVFGSLYRY
jgi:hypothetical protein